MKDPLISAESAMNIQTIRLKWIDPEQALRI